MDALQGNFRVNENLELIGWVRDPARPHDSVEIDVLVNNQRVTTTVADRPRPDMADRFDFTRIGIHLDLAAFGDVAPGAAVGIVETATHRQVPPGVYIVRTLPTSARAPAFDIGNSDSPLTIAQTRHGVFILNRLDQSIDCELLAYGEYAEGEVRLLAELLPRDGVVVDVGANIGGLSIPLARKLGMGGRLFAFEPQSNVFHRLCGNVALNGITNVTCVNAAVGAEEGTATIPRVDYSRFHQSGAIRLGKSGDGDRVPLIKLDTFDFGPGKIGLVKIDVEGLEDQVILGALERIARDQPAVYFECCSRGNFRRIYEPLSALGYDFYWHPAPLYNPNNYAKCARDHFNGAGINSNILAMSGPFELDEKHGLAKMLDTDEFWPSQRFKPEWREKIKSWSCRP